nr:ATP-binding protein [Nonomuraea sp. SBT364]
MTTYRRGLTEEAAEASIYQARQRLRLPTIRGQFVELAAAAPRGQLSYLGFLAELLMAECDYRARKAADRRIKMARFPRQKSLREFDFDANPNVDPAVIHTLADCDWVRKHQPLCLIGDSGTGSASAHRAGHRGRDGWVQGQVHPGGQPGQRTGRGR